MSAQTVDTIVFDILSWHCVLSGSMVRSTTPDPAVYQLAIDTLQLDPGRALFVPATHGTCELLHCRASGRRTCIGPAKRRPRNPNAST